MRTKKVKRIVDEGFTDLIYMLNASLVPPKTTHQSRKQSSSGGSFHTFKSKELVAAEETWSAILSRGRSEYARDERPLKMEMVVCWPFNESAKYYEKAMKLLPKGTKPDLDNIEKTVTDRLAPLGIFKDDCQICWKVTRKFFAEKPTIAIRIYAWKHRIEEVDSA